MPDTTGVLVANLGTPDAPTPAAVRRFLAEFLWDPRVVDLPRLPWWIILNGIILPLRPRKSARAYREVWTEAGSPLLTGTLALAASLQERLRDSLPMACTVATGMTYGKPSIDTGLQQLKAAGVSRLVVLPLYPQYSATTTASVLDRVQASLARWPSPPELRFIDDYHADARYVAAIALILLLGFGYAYVPTHFAARLRRHGVAAGEIETMLVDNPRRVFDRT